MSKTLSNGTLSLRFMQNAQRAKQQAQVELEAAKVKDEAEWEVPKAVKDAWGIGSSSDAKPSDSITHEASYLPFLFTEPSQGGSNPKPSGRRKFNAKGQEVSLQAANDKEPTEDNPRDTQGEPGSSARPTSISGFKVPLSIRHKDTSRTKGKTAQELIREDIKPRPPPQAQSVQGISETGFMKPAGVDGPSRTRTKGIRDSTSLKREREGESGDVPNTEMKKKRKKKEVSMIE